MSIDRSGLRIGIDLGGTKIEAVMLDKAGVIQERVRVPTPKRDYPATIKAVKDLVLGIEGKLPPATFCSVGIGIPGAVSLLTGKIKNANNTALLGHDLMADLASSLGRPVRLANDADCFCLSEATDGAGEGKPSVFGVILGTGVGGGLVCNGQLVQGPNAIAGEWGHNPLPWPNEDERPGPPCYCGQNGCIETFLSGPGLSLSFEKMTGEKISGAEIAQRSKQGDQVAEQILLTYENRLARALASVINLFDPHVIVLGGGVSNMERIYDQVPKIWGQYVFSDQVDTVLARARYGDSSGVRGAAWLW